MKWELVLVEEAADNGFPAPVKDNRLSCQVCKRNCIRSTRFRRGARFRGFSLLRIFFIEKVLFSHRDNAAIYERFLFEMCRDERRPDDTKMKRSGIQSFEHLIGI